MYARKVGKDNFLWTCISNPDAHNIIVCSHSKCGRPFTKPIELNLRINKERARYYACPHCFSPVDLKTVMLEDATAKCTGKPSDNLKPQPSKPLLDSSKIGSIDRDNLTEKTKEDGCSHFIGYLKTCPEDSPIPNECLICRSIMKCMVSKNSSMRKVELDRRKTSSQKIIRQTRKSKT
jgi:hypothetical protein